jgi:hypothetical protein
MAVASYGMSGLASGPKRLTDQDAATREMP